PVTSPAEKTSGSSPRDDDLAREALELLEIVVAGSQDHVLHAGSLEVANARDDLARGPEEVGLLEFLEAWVGAHHALEDGPRQRELPLAVVRVDQVHEVVMPIPQRWRIASDL